jgi:murein DD-endopeptidase MepM/ murein hydrolase activator NlpD
MPSASSPSTRVAGAVMATVTAIVISVFLSGILPVARAASPGQLRHQISAGQGRVSALSGAVSRADQRANELAASAASTVTQIARIQADLNAKRGALLALRAKADRASERLAQLQASERRVDGVLAQQLVGSYESASPDLVTVVVNASGFQNLLEQVDFQQRVARQDAQIAGEVEVARRAVAAQATRLGALSQRAQRLAVQVLYERDRVARERLALLSREAAVQQVRDTRANQLAAARSQVASLRAQLSKAEAGRRAPAAPSRGTGTGSVNFTFPMPKTDVSPPPTWSPDDGVDISAPGGTPEFAVCSGTIVLHGIGGFGPSAPVIHCDSPIDGYDYVYYGHAGPGNWVPVGTHVSQGQTISEVGSGIVGISTGPHLEIGFADSSGSPIGPASAGAMLSLLRTAYGA